MHIPAKLFPTLLIILDFAGAIQYGIDKDFGRAIYWCCAGLLTYSVTYLMK